MVSVKDFTVVILSALMRQKSTDYNYITPKRVYGYRKDQIFVLTGRFARWSNWLDSFRCVIESRQRNSFMTAYYVRYFRPSKLMVYGDAWRALKK